MRWSSSTGETVGEIEQRHAHGIQSAHGWFRFPKGRNALFGRWGYQGQRESSPVCGSLKRAHVSWVWFAAQCLNQAPSLEVCNRRAAASPLPRFPRCMVKNGSYEPDCFLTMYYIGDILRAAHGVRKMSVRTVYEPKMCGSTENQNILSF